MKDKVVPNNSHVKNKKTEVEDHHRISSISNKIKSVTTSNDSLKSRTSNVNAVCATCGKCMFNSNHDACVSKYLNDVNARIKKPKKVPISTRKPKSQANKSVPTPHKKTVASESTTQKYKSYYRMLYEKTSKAWKWWIEQQCPSRYKWVPKTKTKWVPKVRNENVQKRVSFAIDNASRITNVLKLTNTLGSNLSNIPSSSNPLTDYTTALTQQELDLFSLLCTMNCSIRDFTVSTSLLLPTDNLPSKGHHYNQIYHPTTEPTTPTTTVYVEGKTTIIKQRCAMLTIWNLSTILYTGMDRSNAGRALSFDGTPVWESLTNLWHECNLAKVNDMETAFLDVHKEEVYVNQPEGLLILHHPEKVKLSKDADHAGYIDTHKSTSGGIQFLGDKLVSWMSKKQDCNACPSQSIPNELPLADMFTKALPEDRFQYLVKRIGIRCLTPAKLEATAKHKGNGGAFFCLVTKRGDRASCKLLGDVIEVLGCLLEVLGCYNLPPLKEISSRDLVGCRSLQALSNLHYLFSGFMDYTGPNHVKHLPDIFSDDDPSYRHPKEFLKKLIHPGMVARIPNRNIASNSSHSTTLAHVNSF
ncbi:hypothetical protein Tco_1067022 [Tanacetum coccineum]|uniref:Uncharacterized protein n=1 Tax=Tanacetum coccineum TaxID=301880 RepID=A0ABQ5HDG0_9ASTR